LLYLIRYGDILSGKRCRLYLQAAQDKQRDNQQAQGNDEPAVEDAFFLLPPLLRGRLVKIDAGHFFVYAPPA